MPRVSRILTLQSEGLNAVAAAGAGLGVGTKSRTGAGAAARYLRGGSGTDGGAEATPEESCMFAAVVRDAGT